jgi:predicted amidophosphoribosyltransferase
MFSLDVFLDALFANRCVLCNRLGASCCETCLDSLEFRNRQVQRTSSEAKVITGLAAIDFGPEVATLIHHFKEQQRSSLATQFASKMSPLLGWLLNAREVRSDQTVHLVAVPSRASSLIERGFSPGAEIAKALARSFGRNLFDVGGLASDSFRPKVVDSSSWVWRQKSTADQASLNQDQRKSNLRDSMTASQRARDKLIVIVDDIVTTGSSAFETARALESCGAKILGFVTFSETILRNIAKTHTLDSKRV